MARKTNRSLDVAEAVKGIFRSVKDAYAMKIWSLDYLHELVKGIKSTPDQA
ncbi:MAG: hypothetical protein HGB36_12955 [Chlorobiaceae bacterium]|nr:hypothetical protein [Chlorobiaceae bacterium]